MRRTAEIRSLLRHGTRHRQGPLELFRARTAASRSRAGIIVPRYGHTIVERNQLKRRLRECVRTIWLPHAARGEDAQDILVRARPAAYGMSFGELREAFRQCAEDLK